MEKVVPSRFNIRVYGLLFNEGKVLITDEIRLGTKMTKFPGGGLEFGEGLEDGLKREFQEELSVEIEVNELFYINEFLQISSFDNRDQLMSVYYKVSLREGVINTTETPFCFEAKEPQCFRWVGIDDIMESDLTFPIDKVVLQKLKDE